MRLVALFFAWGLSLFATVVTGTIRMPDGSLATGRAYVDLSGTCIGVGGGVIMNPTKIVTFEAGVFSVDLEPSSSCVPSQVYRVRYQIAGWNAPLEYWNVPATGPTTIGAVRVPSIPVQTGSLGIGYLTGGTSKGDIIAYTGSGYTRVPAGTEGYVLRRRNAASNGVAWELAPGNVYSRYSTTVSSATTWTVLGTAHLLGSCAIAVQVWVSNLSVEPDTITCDPTTFDVALTFSSAQTGDVYITSDPVFYVDNLAGGSLITTLVSQPFTAASTITITHNLNAVVILRCYDESNQRLYYDIGTRLSANALTVSFVGSPNGICFVGR